MSTFTVVRHFPEGTSSIEIIGQTFEKSEARQIMITDLLTFLPTEDDYKYYDSNDSTNINF